MTLCGILLPTGKENKGWKEEWLHLPLLPVTHGESVIPILTTLGSEGLRGRRFPKKHTFSRGLSKGTIKF